MLIEILIDELQDFVNEANSCISDTGHEADEETWADWKKRTDLINKLCQWMELKHKKVGVIDTKWGHTPYKIAKAI